MTKLSLIETLPETEGTTWTKTTRYEGRRPVFVHIWADNIITTRLVPAMTKKSPHGTLETHG